MSLTGIALSNKDYSFGSPSTMRQALNQSRPQISVPLSSAHSRALASRRFQQALR